jgi:hypothetical protein
VLEKPILTNVDEYEILIEKYSLEYFANMSENKIKAHMHLIDSVVKHLGEYSFNELKYIFQQVVIRHYNKTSRGVVHLSRRLKINRTTLSQFLQKPGANLLQKPYHTPYRPIDW